MQDLRQVQRRLPREVWHDLTCAVQRQLQAPAVLCRPSDVRGWRLVSTGSLREGQVRPVHLGAVGLLA